jgi:hypothetical protein
MTGQRTERLSIRRLKKENSNEETTRNKEGTVSQQGNDPEAVSVS